MLDENLFRQESHPAPSRMFANLNWEHPSILEAVQDFFGSKIASSLAEKIFSYLQLIVSSPTLERIYRTHALSKHEFFTFCLLSLQMNATQF